MERCLIYHLRYFKLYNGLNQRTLLNTNVLLFRFNSTFEDTKENIKNHGKPVLVTNAKIKLDSIVREVALKLQKDVCLPKLVSQRLGGSKKWKTTLSLGWPEEIVVEGVANNKLESEKQAALHACFKLKELGVLDENLSLSLNEGEKEREMSGQAMRDAKVALSNIFSMVCQKYGSQNWRPKVQFSPFKGMTNQKIGWKATLSIKWPKNFTTEGVGRAKLDAERIAAFKTLEWLRSQAVIDDKNFPILYTENEKSAFIASRRDPLPVSIPESSKTNMSLILEDFENLRRDIESNIISPKRYNSAILESLVDKEIEEEEEEEELAVESNETALFSDNKMNFDEKERSHYLYVNYVSRQRATDANSIKFREMRESLPINDKREEILEVIRQNQVIVLSGEPGCGKTTQVPQFILDEFSSQKKGGICSMVVTQPRRLSTINIAKLVAKQRNETLGETVGYQVRLQSAHPPRNGSILFCSTGVLLQKLHSDPDLNNFSHVIVDEVHERDVQTDFLLVLLKDIIARNKDLKVALMSASLNAEMFSDYFHGCPIIRVPGFMYPVKEHYLPDIVKRFPKSNYRDEMKVLPGQGIPRLNYDLVLDTIRYIDETQGEGAILCFLPGWQDIKAIHKRLSYLFGNSSRHLICSVHSSIPHEEQELIFENPPPGVRKIILSTNIAETSITIDDVVYVIDPGFHKALSYDSTKGVARLGTEWISRANAKQRKGRAGRVKPGECYRLYSAEAHDKLQEFPLPDMMRTPLEKVVIDSKVFCPDMLCKELLAKAPQPPSRSAISRAVADMTQLGVLDQDENLTLLGEKIACFSTHPRLAVALVTASFLKCLESVLNIVSLLSANRDPFHASLDQKSRVKEIKKRFDISKSMSDHLCLAALYESWQYAKEYGDEHRFTYKTMVSRNGMTFSSGLKKIFLNHLNEVGLLDSRNYYSVEETFDEMNLNSPDWDNPRTEATSIVLATLCASFYPNLVRIFQGSWGKSGVKSETIVPTNVDGQLVAFTKESLVSKEAKLPHPYLVYFHSMRSEERNQLMVKDSSPVSSLLVLLTAPNPKLEISKISSKESVENELKVNVILDNRRTLSFSCSENEAQLLLKWRECYFTLFQYYLSQKSREKGYTRIPREINDLMSRFVEEFGTILSSSQRKDSKVE